ncbi:MAG TPA: hypothetical protein VM368_06055 [Flavisolibacter sp.]|nr:hypothetical protein [Flavisolibacter sp.]
MKGFGTGRGGVAVLLEDGVVEVVVPAGGIEGDAMFAVVFDLVAQLANKIIRATEHM